MSTEIKIAEDLWDTDEEAVITTWLAGDGDTVAEGALIAEIMTAKIQHEILAPASGVLSITRQADDLVNKGDVIGTIE